MEWIHYQWYNLECQNFSCDIILLLMILRRTEVFFLQQQWLYDSYYFENKLHMA